MWALPGPQTCHLRWRISVGRCGRQCLLYNYLATPFSPVSVLIGQLSSPFHLLLSDWAMVAGSLRVARSRLLFLAKYISTLDADMKYW